MNRKQPGLFTKLAWSLPWMMRYPLWRASELIRRATEGGGPRHLVFIVANHFEPAWNGKGVVLDWSRQLGRLEDWYKQSRAIGAAIRDSDGTPFRHTNFYPAEQYHRPLLDKLAEMQAEGLGEVEIHLHHGVERPDNAENLKRTLEDFRDLLAEEHKCLSRRDGQGTPMYAFVHGNLALANSAGGRYCGVDSEMQILADTGCYADFSLPAAPFQPQVPRINAIYQCGHPLSGPKPHRSGPNLRVGCPPSLPIVLTGPLVLYGRRRMKGLPGLGIETSVLAADYPLSLARLRRWRKANVIVRGRPEWVFIKLSCHGFFDVDQPVMIGDEMRRFMGGVIEYGERTGQFKVHFASAREAFNIAMAGVDGHKGEPGLYRDYQLRQIMQKSARLSAGRESDRPGELEIPAGTSATDMRPVDNVTSPDSGRGHRKELLHS